MPKRKKRQWIKFNKKVNAVLEKSLAKTSQVFNGKVDMAWQPSVQAFGACWLYGKFGTENVVNEQGLRDLVHINQYAMTESAGIPPVPFQNAKFHITSAVLDATLRNLSNESSLEVDIYEVLLRKDNKWGKYGDMIAQAENETSDTTPAAGDVTLDKRGVTLFDLPLLLSISGTKILKKTKVFLPPGATSTYQIRDPRRHSFNSIDIQEGEPTTPIGMTYENVTRGIVCIAKTVVGQNVSGAMSIGVTRSYKVVLDDSRLYQANYKT